MGAARHVLHESGRMPDARSAYFGLPHFALHVVTSPEYVIRDGMQSVQDAAQCFAMSDATSSSDESHLPISLSSAHVNPIMSFMTMSAHNCCSNFYPSGDYDPMCLFDYCLNKLSPL